jgi:parvulin-like peptidyl-prolyl isomerase
MVMTAFLSYACSSPSDREASLPYPQPEVERKGAVIARVGPVTFTDREIKRRMAAQSELIRRQLVSKERRRMFVEEEVRGELLAQEGWRRGMYKDPRILNEVKRAIVQRMIQDEMKSVSASVSEAELLSAYQARAVEYNKPEKIRLSAILLRAGTDPQRKSATERLTATRSKIQAGLAFADAARRISEDEASKAQGGDLEFLSKDELAARYGQEAAERLFEKADIGSLEIVDVPGAVILFSKTGKRRAVVRPYEAVKPQLSAELLAAKKKEAFDRRIAEMMSRAGVMLDGSAAESLEIDNAQIENTGGL